MNIGVHVSFRITVFSRHMPRNGIAGSYDNSIFSWERLTPAVKRALGTPLQVTHYQDVPLSRSEQAVPVTRFHCVSTSNPPSEVGFVLRGWSHRWSTESTGQLCPGGGVSPREMPSPSFQSRVVVVETEPRTLSLVMMLECSLATSSGWPLSSGPPLIFFLFGPSRPRGVVI